ncbi:MAG TPA: hypothetical protein DEA62_03565, partial [Coxiellaceae bacterium]|nr:hypothetical protein [Coxiellaceae bacterium]
QVAQLAGIPAKVINEAKQKLNQLENYSEAADFASSNNFEQNSTLDQNPKQSELILKLQSIDPNNFTPKEALELLFKLHNSSTE